MNRRALGRALAVLLLGAIVYLTVAVGVLAVSLLLLRRGITPGVPWIDRVQQQLYFEGMRRVWPAEPACAEFDETLIYRPRIGSCRFDNPEFRTTMTFTPEGRETGPKPDGVGIAVLGDSHAMGWGVNDDETFAAELQRLTHRPVFNLAVSSYGTRRELMRFDQSGLADRVDTVILQYCDNDLDENVGFKVEPVEVTRRKFESIGAAVSGRARVLGTVPFLVQRLAFTLRAPVTIVRELVFPARPLDFARHHPALVAAIAEHPSLATKRVLVFYSNSRGSRFVNYPGPADARASHLEFLDLPLQPSDYYRVDDHLTPDGHRKVARLLAEALRTVPAGGASPAR